MRRQTNKSPKRIKSIAFVVWLFPKLSETFILNQIIHLLKKGYKISIFAVKDPRKELAKEDLEVENIVHEDVKIYQLSRLTKYGSLKELSSLLKKGVKKKKIDIIYFQFSDLAAEIFKYGKIQYPTISVFHDISRAHNKVEYINLKKKYESVFKNATLILATSEFTKNELIRLGCKNHKILVHHMGIDTNIFKPPKLKISTCTFNFLMIGRFVEKKGFIYGIRAFKKILERYPRRRLKLSIVGDGILRETLKQEVKRLRVENEVNFLGKLSQKKIVRLLQRSHCFLCPSVTTQEGKREGSPTVVMEVAACGVPIIATKHAGIPEILKNNYSILVKERSIPELAEGMSKIVNNYQRYKRELCSKARELVNQEYNVKIQVKHLLKIFNLTLQMRRRELAFQEFSSCIKKHLSSEVFSVIVVGSISRREILSKHGDVDIIIVFKNPNFIHSKTLLKLAKAVNLLKNYSGLQITPQIFTKYDLFQLLSPVLIRNYIEDGEVIYGEDIIKIFKKRIASFSKYEYDINLLKRDLFERYFSRQYVTTFSKKSNHEFYRKIAKTVLFLARDLLYLEKDIWVTTREEIAKAFYREYRDKIPLSAFIIFSQEKPLIRYKNFLPQAIDFVETTCVKIIRIIKDKYPNKKIYVHPF